MTRHRFAGLVGQLCSWSSAGVLCALNYSASLHFNDDDHPYDPGEPAGASCGWQLQNVTGHHGGNLFCWRMADDPVHKHDEAAGADETLVMQYPPVEPAYPDGRVYGSSADAPMEDGVPERSYRQASEPWAEAEAEEQRLHHLEEQLLDIGGEPGSAARARWDLENGQVVGGGPWPVRQWFCPDGGAPEAWEMPGELLCALNVAGEPFVVYVWWRDSRTRLVRVTWGALLGATDLGAAVESWPTE